MKPASDQICPQISDCSRGLKMDPSRSPFVQPGLTSMDAQHATGELYRWWPLPVDQIIVVASFAVASAGWKYSPLWTKFHQLTSKWQMSRAVFYGCDLQTRDIPIIPFICLFCTPMHIRGRSHITSAAGGGRGGKPNADDCWRGGVKSGENLMKWV